MAVSDQHKASSNLPLEKKATVPNELHKTENNWIFESKFFTEKRNYTFVRLKYISNLSLQK